MSAPVLTDVRVDFDGFDAYAVEPAAIPDVLAARPVVVSGKWRGEPRGQLVLEGRAATGTHTDVVPVRADADASCATCWARSRIQQLSTKALEGGSGQRDAITALGLPLQSLLARYASFIAINQDWCAPPRPPRRCASRCRCRRA